MTQIVLSLTGLSLVAAVILIIPAHADPGILYAKPDGLTSGPCDSWTNACTLQQALSVATSGNEIWVQKGVHYPGTTRDASFSLKNDVALYGGFAGTESSRSQRNWQVNLTVLSGDIDKNDITDANGVVTATTHISGTNSYHVISTTNVISTAILDGFVVTAGQANENTWPHSSGGGMLNSFSSPTLQNLTFKGNTAAAHGGGMFNSQSNPTLTNVSFSGNTASQSGGGMYNDRSSPTLANITFGNNMASSGGGIFNYLYSNPTLRNVVFNSNTASSSGGGMYNDYKSNPTLVNVTFGGNTADNGDGMYNVQSSPVLTNVIMWDNSTGGIINNSGANPTIAHSNIRGCGGSGSSWNSTCGSDGGHNIDIDPLFVNPTDGNLRLQAGSPCIDAGDNAAATGVTIDLDGNPRIADGDEDGTPVVDMGVYELQPPSPAPTTMPTAAPTTVPIITPTTVITSPHVYLPAVRK